jgi:hypothetical protein
MGYVGWLGKYDSEDSVLTHLLRKAGAVFYVKTSVPQTLMVCETINNVIGRTVNPRNKLWSCGGSSGGEGAMVGLRGGIIGVGTDIGKTCWGGLLRETSLILATSRFDPCPVSVQFLVWHSTKPRPFAIRQDGKQHGRSRDGAQRSGANGALSTW